MFFKLTQNIRDEHFGKPEYSPMIFEYSQPTIVVCFKNVDGKTKNSVLVETTLERSPNKKTEKVFRNIYEEFYSKPENKNPLVEKLKERNKINGISEYSLPYDILPDYFLDFCDGVRRDLRSFSSRTYNSMRWVDNIKGSNSPYSNSNLIWSFDGIVWKEFVGRLVGEVRLYPGLYSSEKYLKLVKETVQLGNSEPLGHELLREAASLKNEYPRSSMLIAISAAETAIKQCIVALQPETKWLIENMASPDILKLFREYIPKIAIKQSRKQLSVPTNTVLSPLRKSIQIRNLISHGGTCNLKESNVTSTLRVIKNFLYILDYYMGNEWAIEHLDKDVKLEMRVDDAI